MKNVTSDMNSLSISCPWQVGAIPSVLGFPNAIVQVAGSSEGMENVTSGMSSLSTSSTTPVGAMPPDRRLPNAIVQAAGSSEGMENVTSGMSSLSTSFTTPVRAMRPDLFINDDILKVAGSLEKIVFKNLNGDQLQTIWNDNIPKINLKIIQFLISAGKEIGYNIDVNACSELDEIALSAAAKSGQKDAVEALLKMPDVDVNAWSRKARETALMSAARTNQVGIINLLQQQSADASLTDSGNKTALMIAVINGHQESVESLLPSSRMYLDIQQNGYCNTALILAAELGHKKIVELLLDQGADVNLTNHNNQTALMIAAAAGHLEIVTLLLKSKNIHLNIRENNSGDTALISAIKFGHEKIVELLLNQGADVNPINCNNQTALMIAARHGYERIVALLLKKRITNIKIQENWTGDTALICAARSENTKVVSMILENGADINLPNNDGTTPLMIAVWRGNEEMTQRLLEHHNINLHVQEKRYPCNTTLIYAAGVGNTKILNLLLGKYIDIDQTNCKKETALMIAAENIPRIVRRPNMGSGRKPRKIIWGDVELKSKGESEYKEALKLLLEKGANIDQVNSQNETAFIYAAKSGHPEIARLLLENGANIHQGNSQGKTALMYAAESGFYDVCELLLEMGANINQSDYQGKTALMYAAEADFREVSELLLKKGANINQTDAEGKTALMYASKPEFGKDDKAAQLFLKNGADINLRDSKNRTAFMIAQEDEYSDMDGWESPPPARKIRKYNTYL